MPTEPWFDFRLPAKDSEGTEQEVFCRRVATRGTIVNVDVYFDRDVLLGSLEVDLGAAGEGTAGYRVETNPDESDVDYLIEGALLRKKLRELPSLSGG